MIERRLDLGKITAEGNSTFLFGARGVGKTWLIRETFSSRDPGTVLSIDLLQFSEYSRYLRNPTLFREEVLAFRAAASADTVTVIIDEVQRLPELLNEVHSLINEYQKSIQFILSGSSARKLRRQGTNLLAGRALSNHLHPLVQSEFSAPLHRRLLLGDLPGIVLDNPQPIETLKGYAETYLKEEIFQEALVRRLDSFTRFLEVAAQYHTKAVQVRTIAKASGASAPTIAEYLQILEDTLIAFRLPGWNASTTKQLRTTPKLYLFDNGVANALRGELSVELRESSSRFGELFEAMVIQEIYRALDYDQLEFKLSYWQTNYDAEVDIVLSRGAGAPVAAIEIKSGTQIEDKHLSGLLAFAQDWPEAKLQCWARVPRATRRGTIEILPWELGIAGLAEL